jgi:hypothetical protein
MQMQLLSVLTALMLGASVSGQSFSFDFQDDFDISSPSSCLGMLLTPSSYVGECHEPWEVLKTILMPTKPDLGYAYVGKL